MDRLRKHKTQLILAGILLLASFLRLYKIGDYLTFLGDEGRDVLIAKHILEGDLVFLGPRSSAADFFYGPVYYYMITPFLWLFNYDPVGPAVMVALIGIATVYLVYRVGKEFFGTFAGVTAAALYAVAPLVIGYSRSSWNPNPLPFVSLLSLYLLYKAGKTKSWKLYISIGFLLGIAFQMQYLATFLAVVIGMYVFVSDIFLQKKEKLISLGKHYGLITIGFILGWSPFLAFEIKNGFPNIRTLINLVLGKIPSSSIATDLPFYLDIWNVFFRLFGRLVTRFPRPEEVVIQQRLDLMALYIGTIALGFLAIAALYTVKDKRQKFLLLLWTVFGISLFMFYNKPIYDYYLGFMFPLPFLLIGNLLATIYHDKRLKRIGKGVGIGLFLLLFIYNLFGMPFRYQANRQKDQVEGITDFVLSKTNGKPFNFALITPGNSDHGYRYFFEIKKRPPVVIENTINDPQRKTVTDQLLIVCEDITCKPLGYSLHEVAGFGRGEIVGEWDVSVVKVFKIEHYDGKDDGK